MKLDNETKSWLDEQARQGCNQRDVANQLMQRINTTDPPPYVLLTYEQAVNLYKSARKRVRKSVEKTQIQCDDDKQVYVHHSPASVTSEPNGAPAGILIPVEADDLRMLQVSPEGPEQAPEVLPPDQDTPPTSEAPPEHSVNDPSSRVEEVPNLQFSELFPGLIPSQVPELSKYVSEDPQGEYAAWCHHVSNPTIFLEKRKAEPKPEVPQVKSYRGALADYVESVVFGGERNYVIEETYADDAELLDRLVSLLGPEVRSKWDNGTMNHDQIVALFKGFSWEVAVKTLGERLGWRWDFAGTLDKRALFEEMCDKIAEKLARVPVAKGAIDKPTSDHEDDLEQAFWDYDSSRKRCSERDAFKMTVRGLLKSTNSDVDPNNDRYDRIYEAQLGMYNGIRDLTDAVRALPIASVLAAKDETIAAKDAELETLREYVRHLQRQIGAA